MTQPFKNNKIFFVLITIIIIAINYFPYFYAKIIERQNDSFSGAIFYTGDTGVYLSEMAQGSLGRWFTVNQFTQEDVKPATHIFYLWLGKLTKLFSGSMAEGLFIARLLSGILLLSVIYYFLGAVFDNVRLKNLAYLIVGFSGGFGWLFMNLFSSLIKNRLSLPVDISFPDAIAFWRFSYPPHILLSHALLILSFTLVIKALRKYDLFCVVLTGLCLFLLNFITPTHTAVFYLSILILFIFFLILRKISKTIIKIIILPIILSLPSFIMMSFVVLSDKIWNQIILHSTVTVSPSPSLVYYLIGYGIMAVFSVIGIIYLAKRKLKNEYALLFAWFLSVILLSFFKISFQQRFIETAFYVVMAVLAGFGLYYLLPRYFTFSHDKYLGLSYKNFVLFFIFITILSNIYVLNRTIQEISYYPKIMYFDKEIERGITYLKNNASDYSIVLSSFSVGNYIPYLADKKVYIGHWVGTINLEDKMEKAGLFYKKQIGSEQAYNFIKQNKIGYVIYSDWEKDIGYLDPSSYSFLEPVYRSKSIIVYKVN